MSISAGRPRSIVISLNPVGVTREFGLGDHLDVVASASTLEGVADGLVAERGVVVAVDMALPDAAAPHAIRELASARPRIGVVALIPAPLDEALVSRALRAGADACVTQRTVAEHGSTPFRAAARGEPFLPTGELREMLAAEGDSGDLTSSERSARLRNLVIGLISLAGALAGLVASLWRQYLGQIGVRPVDLGVDPTTRLADVFFTVSVMVGVIGAQVFVGSWLDLIIDTANERVATWLRRHRTLSYVTLALVTLAVTVVLARFTELLFALFVGPLVGGLLLAKMFELDDDLPAVLRITRLNPGRAVVGAAAIFAVFLALLSYEVVVRGPEFDERGEVRWIAPTVLGFNAEPVRVTAVESGAVTEMLYLGGNADLYVLVDPCDGDRVDYVSVGATRLTVIDRIRCD